MMAGVFSWLARNHPAAGEGLAGEYDDPTTSRAGMAKEPNIELFRLLEGRHPVDHALERVRIA